MGLFVLAARVLVSGPSFFELSTSYDSNSPVWNLTSCDPNKTQSLNAERYTRVEPAAEGQRASGGVGLGVGGRCACGRPWCLVGGLAWG